MGDKSAGRRTAKPQRSREAELGSECPRETRFSGYRGPHLSGLSRNLDHVMEVSLCFGTLSAGESGVALHFPPQSKIVSRNDQARFQSTTLGAKHCPCERERKSGCQRNVSFG